MFPQHPLYREVGTIVQPCLSHLPAPTRTRVVFFLFGILLAGTIVLRVIATRQARRGGGSTSAASHERRLRRVLNDPGISWQQVYQPTVKQVLHWQRAKRLLILIDESGHTDRFRVLEVAVWYRGRAIPLAWVSWPAQTKLDRSYWDYTDEVLDMLQTLLPDGVPIVIIGDRAFGNPAFLDRVAQRGWDWLVRIQHQTCFRDAQGGCWAMNQVLQQRGQRWKGRGWLFKKAGWRAASAVASWGQRHKEPLLLASSLPAQWDVIALYRKRSAIEALFRDRKSAGWDWEASQVRDLAHHERVLVGMALATLLVLCLGNQQANDLLAQPARPRRTRPWHAKDSLFRLGLDTLDARLWQTDQTPIVWSLDQFDDPGWQDAYTQRQTDAYVFAQVRQQAA